MKDDRDHIQLFDLIAREWTLPDAAQRVVFNHSGTAVAFDCGDGAILLAATADKGSPNLRVKRAVDNARMTISPRKTPVSPLKAADHTDGRSSAVVPFGPSAFAFGKVSGRINTLTPGGLAVHIPARAHGPVQALAATADGTMIAYAVGAAVYLGEAEAVGGTALDAPGSVTALAFSPDGATLAATTDTGVTVWPVATRQPGHTPLPRAESLQWARDGRWLLACCASEGLAVIDTASGTAHSFGQFPAPVRSAGFGAASGTVIAAGAFRIAGWTLEAPPCPVLTGKAGLMLVDAVAASPDRNLVAVGYANGLVSLAEVGGAGEMLLRENTGAGVAAMAWSADGVFLAISGTDGSAALVEFPTQMFKS